MDTKAKKGRKASQQQALGDEGNAIFVRGLPPSTTSEQLEKFFGGVGPLRRSFVVTEAKTQRCTGAGFLHFALREDAKKALQVLQGSTFGGRRLQLDFARRRQRRLPVISDVPENITPTSPDTPDASKCEFRPKPKGNLKGSVANRTVLVRADTKDVLLDADIILSKLGGNSRSAGYESHISSADGTIMRFLFRTWPQAGAAASQIHGDGLNACVEALSGGQKCKLIVRNLPFKLNVSEVRAVFNQIAIVREINVPLPNNQRGEGNQNQHISLLKADTEFISSRGFAFVEYFLAADANRAIEKVNGTKIGGRPVAVDLALGKSEFAKKIAAISAPVETNQADDLDDDDDNDDVSNEDGAESSGSDENGTEKTDRKGPESSEEEMKRTAFVRNLLFETDSSELWAAMESKFGPIEQAVVVKDPITGRSRGTAFVRFSSMEQLNSALSKSDESDKKGLRIGGTFTLQGRDLLIVPALRRDDARDKVVGTNEKSDRRNMRLAWIGHIKSDSVEGRRMSEADLGKRLKAEKEKRAKLSNNPNAFVSDTRLCIRNLPKFVEEKVLKYICLGVLQVKGGSRNRDKSFPKITHAKVVRDARRNDKSRGFGFVQFAEHRHALQALHKLNNTANVMDVVLEAKAKRFGVDESEVSRLRSEWEKDRRLFVEFSVEDSRTVAILEKLKKKGQVSKELVGAELKRKNGECSEDKTGGSTVEETKEKRKRRKKNPKGKVKVESEDRFESLLDNYKRKLKQ